MHVYSIASVTRAKDNMEWWIKQLIQSQETWLYHYLADDFGPIT